MCIALHIYETFGVNLPLVYKVYNESYDAKIKRDAAEAREEAKKALALAEAEKLVLINAEKEVQALTGTVVLCDILYHCTNQRPWNFGTHT